ncbi:MAG: 50S ribosomal protein L23 [Nanoarchaeota archaeon]|nr:50S ribosomal protein L23 [Nanoarchaeota archaeon]
MADADKVEVTSPENTAPSQLKPASKKETKPTTEAPKKAVVEKKSKPAEKPTKAEKKKEEPIYDPWRLLRFSHLTEKSMVMVERQNKLVFIVKRNATKQQVRTAIEKGFKVKVDAVNLQHTHKGIKKAYVTLNAKNPATELATRLGMM